MSNILKKEKSTLSPKMLYEIEMIISEHIWFFYQELRNLGQLPPSPLERANAKDPTTPTGINLLYSCYIHQDNTPPDEHLEDPFLPKFCPFRKD
jgi:hypothetical protein